MQLKVERSVYIRSQRDNNHRFLKLRCDERFTHAFTACSSVFNEITLVGSNQGNYFENATACIKRTLKTTVATQLNVSDLNQNRIAKCIALFLITLNYSLKIIPKISI